MKRLLILSLLVIGGWVAGAKIAASTLQLTTCQLKTTVYDFAGNPKKGVKFFIQTHSTVISNTLITPASFTVETNDRGVVRFTAVRASTITVRGEHPSFAAPTTITVPSQAEYDLINVGNLNLGVPPSAVGTAGGIPFSDGAGIAYDATNLFWDDTDNQFSVGTSTADASALVDFSSTTKGLLPPRMTTAQRDAVVAPAAGLFIYNSTTAVINFRNASAWIAPALTTDNLSVFAATTSAQLAGVINDETGSGLLVFGTSPIITTSLSQDGDVADAGYLRLQNAAQIAWEASPAAADITLTVDTSEVMQASGTFNAATLTEGANAVPNVTDNLSFFAATTSAQLAGVLSNETGTGVFVLDTSPTFTTSLITPAVVSTAADPGDAGVIRLGNAELIGWEASPAAADITLTVDTSEIMQASGTFNATTLTESANGVPNSTDNLSFFAATTSAQLAGVLSNETGTGLFVLDTSPTFTTSLLTPAVVSTAADPADAGVLRLANAELIAWEASPVAGDITLTVDASEIMQASGTFNATVLTESANGIPNVTDNLSVFAATTSLQLLGVISDETGSGALVFGTSPVITTSLTQDGDAADAGYLRLQNAANIAWEASPAAADITLTVDTSEIMQASGTFNATTLTEGANAVPNVTDNLSVFAATTSAQLAGVLSDETGTGIAVFDTAPSLTTSLTINLNNATTAVADTMLTIAHNSTGTPAASFGSKIAFNLESDTTADRNVGELEMNWLTATDASRDGRFAVQLANDGVLATYLTLTAASLAVTGSTGAIMTRTVAFDGINAAIQVGIDKSIAAANGDGSDVIFFAEDSLGNKEFSARAGGILTNVTNGSETGAYVIRSRLNSADTNATTEVARLLGDGNIGFNTTSFGTSAAKVLALGAGTAPTTSPADSVQLWVADAAAGDATLYARNELGEIDRLTGQTARNSAQFDKTSDTTLANVTGLTRNVEAARTYKFRAVLYTTSNSAGGVKFAVAGTATATSIIYEAVVFNAAALSAQTRATALASAVGGVTAVTVAFCIIEGTIVVNAGGTLTVQFAQNASTGTASSVLVNSTFTIQSAY